MPPPRRRTGRVRAAPQGTTCPEQSASGQGIVAAGDAFGGGFGIEHKQQGGPFLECDRMLGGRAGRVRVAAFTPIGIQCQIG
jgi:hypothetical protein